VEVCLNKFFISMLILFVLCVGVTACGGVPFIAQNEPTATATRRIRPTFTPKPRPTDTPEVTPTDEPTETQVPETTTEPPTQVPVTKAPTKVPAAPRPTKPPAPTEPPKPAFAVTVTSQYLCEQDGIFEVALNAKKGKAFIEGLYFAAFDSGGRLLQDGAGKNLVSATYPASQSTGSNCRLSGSFDTPNIDNGKLDVGDAVRAGTNPIIIRFVKSATDMTPISPDITINFGKGGRYWIFAQMQ
jgi:hypothetical protein